MADEENEQYEPLTALSPDAQRWWRIYVAHHRIDFLARHMRHAAYEAAYIVPEIVQSPRTHVFEGAGNSVGEPQPGADWLCYCGRPAASYTNEGRRRDPWPGQIYLIFLNRHRIAYSWRWEWAKEKEPHPIGNPDRFQRRIR